VDNFFLVCVLFLNSGIRAKFETDESFKKVTENWSLLSYYWQNLSVWGWGGGDSPVYKKKKLSLTFVTKVDTSNGLAPLRLFLTWVNMQRY
jgi:hypothetical protein